jgi:shikimate kinase
MASGKSTLGKKLAQTLEIDFLDTDNEIEKKAGAEISWIFEVEGEDGFRERESKALQKSVEKDNVVISTGGGIVTIE